jgi:hypothetical protein
MFCRLSKRANAEQMQQRSRILLAPLAPRALSRSRRAVRLRRRHFPEVAYLEQRSLLSTLYAVGSGVGNGSSNLYKIANYASAPTAINIGKTGVLLSDIAIDPRNDAAYAISFKNLCAINLSTAKATEIGPLGFSGMNALAFSSSGTLYAMSTYSIDLYTINATTGRATIDFNTGYRSSGGITVGTNGAVYLTTATDLVRINLRSKKATVVGPTGVSNLFGLAFGSDGTIYAGQSPGAGKAAAIYKIDDSTGHATKIGTIAGSAKLGLEGWAF